MCSVATIKADCAMKLGHKHGRVAEACSLATGGEDATYRPNEPAEHLLCAVTDNDDEASANPSIYVLLSSLAVFGIRVLVSWHLHRLSST